MYVIKHWQVCSFALQFQLAAGMGRTRTMGCVGSMWVSTAVGSCRWWTTQPSSRHSWVTVCGSVNTCNHLLCYFMLVDMIITLTLTEVTVIEQINTEWDKMYNMFSLSSMMWFIWLIIQHCKSDFFFFFFINTGSVTGISGPKRRTIKATSIPYLKFQSMEFAQ